MKPLVLLLSILLINMVSIFAQTTPVNNYTISQHDGTYSEISGGLVHGTETNDDESFNAISLGFVFNFNGTDYTEASIQSNGYIAMGTFVSQVTNPISNTNGTSNVISPLGTSLQAQPGATLMSKTEGESPNRVFIVQWKNYKFKNAQYPFDHAINFQLRLYETSNKIEFVYGAFSFYENDDFSCQVGLRGNNIDDYNNRDNAYIYYQGNGLYYDWDITKKGVSQYIYLKITPGKKPYSGLTFVYEEPYSLDVGIANLTSPNRIFNTEGEQDIKVNLYNYGTNTITSATIKWKVNDGAVNSFSWSGSLAQANTAEDINIGTYDFSGEDYFTIEVWTENPNGSADENPDNNLFKSYHAINQYCTSGVVYDEWYYFREVIIGNIYHYMAGTYENYTVNDYSPHFNANYAPGSNLDYSIFVGSNGYVAFWIDYNDDNDFDDADEYLGTSGHFEFNEHLTGSITFSQDAPEGMHKLRVRYIRGDTAPGAGDACTPLSQFDLEGDAHDYAINIYNPTEPPPCVWNPIPGNSSVDVVLNKTLEWASESATDFDVYFGTETTPPFIQNQTENLYSPGLLNEFTTYHWKIIAKNEFGASQDCETWSFTTGDELEYCIPGYSECWEWNDMIDDFYMESLIHENSECSSAGYGDFTETAYTTNLVPGANVTWAANYGTQDALAIWIDYNDDGVFNETDEFVYRTEPVGGVHVYINTGQFNIPANVQLGTHRMRVRCAFTPEVNNQFEGNQACTGIAYGETHDYNITITEPTNPPECASAPFPENESAGQYLNSDLSWTANQATSYDVFFGTTTLEYMGVVSEAVFDAGVLEPNTEYQWQIFPKNGAGQASGCDVWVFTTGEELEYCMQDLYYGDAYSDPCDWGEYIDDFSIGDLIHTETGCDGGFNVADFTFMSVDLAQGSNYTWTANIHTTAYLAIWFDTNNDGAFDETECMYSSPEQLMPDCSGTITIPAVAALGEHRFRIRLKGSGVDPIGFEQACFPFAYGEAHDYTVNVTEATQPPECAINPEPADGTTEIILNYGDVSWQADYASEFDVYFGTDENPPLVSENQNYANFNPGILQANTTYYWKIIPSNSLGGPSDCDVWTFTTAGELEYCTNLYTEGLDYNCQWGDDIDDFLIADFEHIGTGCYSNDGQAVDYTNLSFNLENGDTYTFTVTNNNAGWNHFAIWIDYNNDGEFNNSNEFIFTTDELIPASYSNTITIAEDAPIGEHRIRLRLKSSEPPMTGDDACTYYYFGETHDYTVNITNITGIANIDVTEQIRIYPNPANSFIKIEANNPIKNISIYNGIGHLVYNKNINHTECKLNTAALMEGFYIIRIETEKGIYHRNIIISH